MRTDAPEVPRGDIAGFGRLWQFVRPYRARFAVAMVALVIAAGAVLALGQGLRHVIDTGIHSANAAVLDRLLGGMLAVVVTLAAATYVRFYLVSWIGERVVADIRHAVFDHLLTLSPGYFETQRTGDVISRLTSDVAQLDNVLGTSVSLAVRNALLLTGGLIMLFLTSPRLTALALVGIPFIIVPTVVLGRRVRRLARASQDAIAEVSAYVDEAVHEVRTVQAYGHEPHDRAAFGTRAEGAFDTAVARIRRRALLIALVILLAFGAVGILMWIGGHDILAGRLTAGELSAFVFYSIVVAGAVGAVSETWGELQRGAGAAERILELLATAPAVRSPPDAQPLPVPARGEVSFENVTFHYPSRPDTPALDHFTLTVARGEKLALVGPSGAGKTTVFQLLLRFYDPTAGAIRLDGVELARADLAEVRRRIALVPQDPVIFAGTVADNVRYGRPDAGDDDVRRACTAAYADEFVALLPERYDTPLGERGVRLSGGQRQRIAIARAILADRPVLLLDEATSALDAESERMVQLALAELMRGRTTLIIAHRLATVQNADRIVVMDRGRLIAAGTHDELVAAGGLYAHLAALQFQARA